MPQYLFFSYGARDITLLPCAGGGAYPASPAAFGPRSHARPLQNYSKNETRHAQGSITAHDAVQRNPLNYIASQATSRMRSQARPLQKYRKSESRDTQGPIKAHDALDRKVQAIVARLQQAVANLNNEKTRVP